MAAAEALKMDQTMSYSGDAAGPFIFHPLTMPAQLILAINARNLLPSGETVLLQEAKLLLLFNYASPEIATVAVGGGGDRGTDATGEGQGICSDSDSVFSPPSSSLMDHNRGGE